jgi:hypothetical protein
MKNREKRLSRSDLMHDVLSRMNFSFEQQTNSEKRNLSDLFLFAQTFLLVFADD